MQTKLDRRTLLRAAIGSSAVAAAAPGGSLSAPVRRTDGTRVSIGLNAYSFNAPLRAGETTLMDVVDFCATHRLDCLDATGYYFPGYPAVPADEFLFELSSGGLL